MELEMLIMIGLLLLVVIGGIIAIVTNVEDIGEVIFYLNIVLLMLLILFVPISRLNVNAGIQQFNSVKATIDSSRLKSLDYETAALVIKIAEQNQWMVKVQYLNKTIFDIWIPDAVENLQPIR